jgi:hypothetical protein
MNSSPGKGKKMNSADKLRNIVREALRNFIAESGIAPKGMEFQIQELNVHPGSEPPKEKFAVLGIELIFRK